MGLYGSDAIISPPVISHFLSNINFSCNSYLKGRIKSMSAFLGDGGWWVRKRVDEPWYYNLGSTSSKPPFHD